MSLHLRVSVKIEGKNPPLVRESNECGLEGKYVNQTKGKMNEDSGYVYQTKGV